MERNTLETVLGAVVLLVAGYFLYLVYSQTNVGAEASGYPLELRFDSGGSTGDRHRRAHRGRQGRHR